MSTLPQARAPNPHTNLLNVYIQIANKTGFQQQQNPKSCVMIPGSRGLTVFPVIAPQI
jgi:hypothetical protein